MKYKWWLLSAGYLGLGDLIGEIYGLQAALGVTMGVSVFLVCLSLVWLYMRTKKRTFPFGLFWRS